MTQHKETHCSVQHFNIQHDETQQRIKKYATQFNFTLSVVYCVTVNTIMLNVVLLTVVMLGIVANLKNGKFYQTDSLKG